MQQNTTWASRLRVNIRKRIISGLLILIPLGVTIFVLQFIFGFLSANLHPVIKPIFGNLPEVLVHLLSIVLFILLLYCLGLIATHVIGKQIISLGERLLMYIPIVKPIYHTSKQILEALSGSGETFRSVVFIEYPRPGLKALAFKVGAITGANGEEFIKVIVPTSPNPTSGFLVFIPAADVQETDLTVEAGMKIIISGGILTSEKFEITTRSDV